MFFNRKKKMEELKEQPLNYWEKESYMMAILEGESDELPEGFFERVAAIEGLTMKAKSLPDENYPGVVIFDYDGEEYEARFEPGGFQWSPLFGTNNYRFSEEELARIQSASRGLTVFMEFHEDCKKSFHIQLKLVTAMAPDMIGLLDESAEKMISVKWAMMAAASEVTPGPEDLFIVHAVPDKKGEVWLHTHGLCRCGLTELEILQSDKENYVAHFHLLCKFAGQLMDKTEPFVPRESSKYVGMLTNRQPVVVTYVPWTEGIKEYRKLGLGDPGDRKDGHNTRTGIIFVYKNKEDEANGVLSKVSDYDGAWGDNPLFFISNEETDRMARLARERFRFVREYAKKEGHHALIKIALLRDDSETDSVEREHIWFELLEFEEDGFRARLTQEPYAVAAMHEGDEGFYTIDDVTDWMIYTPEFSVSPTTAYRLG